MLTKEEETRLRHNLIHHTPDEIQVRHIEELRAEAIKFGVLVLALCPDKRERSLALTKLEETLFWANASIARY
jgi:hypothetical protein